jgi:nicotinic acid mononucleotide adenylyltransferase
MKAAWCPEYIIIILLIILLSTLMISQMEALHYCCSYRWKSSLKLNEKICKELKTLHTIRSSSYGRHFLKLHARSNTNSFISIRPIHTIQKSSNIRSLQNNIWRHMTTLNHFQLFDDKSENDYSLENLQERMKQFIATCIQSTTDGSSLTSRQRLVVMFSGGGGHFLSALSSTPGASSVLLEGSNYYDRESYRQIVQLRKRLEHNKIDIEQFQYCSTDAASYLTDAALQRAIELSAIDFSDKQTHSSHGSNAINTGRGELCNYLLSACGVACTSALFTTEGLGGKPVRANRASRAHIGVKTASGIKISLTLKLSLQNRFDECNGSIEKHHVRNRFDEDVIVSHWILNCLQIAAMDKKSLKSMFQQDNTTSESTLLMDMKTVEGDEIHLTFQDSRMDEIVDTKSSNDHVFLQAAERILSGINQTAMLIPTQSENSAECSFQLLVTTVLPPRSLLVPGSFNPPHKGHILLARNAADTSGCTSIWFELSITNADKPPLEAQEVLKRLDYFARMHHDAHTASEVSSMPQNWGIILTDAPLFKQKVDLLEPLLLHGDREESNSRLSLLHFCIGTDTLIRLVDNKYYSNSEEKMMDLLINQMPCHFVVGGRLEQKKSARSDDDIKFITGVEHLNRLPLPLRNKFTLLPNFRVDASSTEIRQKLEEEHIKEGKTK